MEVAHPGMVVDPSCADAFDDQQALLAVHVCRLLPIVVNRKCVDTILHTLSHCLQHVICHVVQFDQKRVQRIAVLYIPAIKTRDSAFVVKPEKSLLQKNRSACDAPGTRECSFCALGTRDLVTFMSSIWAHRTPVTFHESENGSCVSGTAIPQRTT